MLKLHLLLNIELGYLSRFICALFNRVTETHALAAANQQKNDRLRAAFGISNDYVDGSSFHTDRKEKEKEKREQERLEREKLQQQTYMYVFDFFFLISKCNFQCHTVLFKNDVIWCDCRSHCFCSFFSCRTILSTLFLPLTQGLMPLLPQIVGRFRGFWFSSKETQSEEEKEK